METTPAIASLPLTVERFGIIARYVVYAVAASLFLSGYIHGEMSDFVAATIIVVVHNGFAHGVFWTRRYLYFFGKLNFAIYFAEANLVTLLTGAESSEAYILYHLFIIGFSAYKRSLRAVIGVALLCMASYSVVILDEWHYVGIDMPAGVIVIKLMSILVCGWLVGALAQLLGQAEERTMRQAHQLAASEGTLRTILDSTGEPILVFDDNEFITEANEQAAVFLGLGREQVLGQRIRAYLFDDGTLPHKFAHLRTRGESRGEEVVVDAHGEEHAVEIVVRSFMGEHKRYYVALLRDITDRKNLQEATRLTHLRLERLTTELRQIDRLKTGFLTSISQRLRSPLSAVAGYVEMLLEEELGEINPDQRKALQTCRRSLLSVFKLVDESLDLHRLESRRERLADSSREHDPRDGP
jgi:PAS domain S-box-containing protein